MQKEVRQTWFFRQSPEEVWDYLTKPELLALWLMETDFQPVVGHKFRFVCSVVNDCEVLEVHPYKKLSYSWQTNSAKTGKPFNSKVVWTLTKKDDGTELQLVHDGFTALEDVTGHDEGWNRCGNRLAQLSSPVKTTTAQVKQ
jgi:uncharacterized protein YndB with AHSA1/START domain